MPSLCIRYWLATLGAFLALGCESTPHVRRDRLGRPLPKPAVAALASLASVPLPAPPGLDNDPRRQAFDKALIASCKVPPLPETTWGITQNSQNLEACAASSIKRELASLSPARRRGLTAVPETRRHNRDDWYPAWSRFVDAACYVDDMIVWNSGASRLAGTMRSNTIAACFLESTTEAAYWVHSYVHGDAAEFARHILFGREAGVQMLQVHRQLLLEAERRALNATEAPTPDDACMTCALSDADWRKQARTLAALRDAIPPLADALCRSWPDLARQLNGVVSCTALAELYFAAQAGGTSAGQIRPNPYERLARLADEPEVEREDAWRPLALEPLAKDRDYATFIEPLLQSCEQTSDDDYLLYATQQKCLQQARRAELEPLLARARREAAGIDQDWRQVVDDLCQVEQVVSTGIYSHLGTSFSASDCALLSEARGTFLFHAWRSDDAAAFVGHVAYRRQWGEHVRTALASFETVVRAAPCEDGRDGLSSTCRVGWVPKADWTRTAQALAALPGEAQSLARQLCAAWPALVRSLDGECEPAISAYILSYGHTLGRLYVDEP